MLSIARSSEFKLLVPSFVGVFIEADVINSPTSSELWRELEECGRDLRVRHTPDSLKMQSAIAATRAAYKACGKDPSRYRPAGEQLARRLLQGKELYSVDTLVDLGNLVSLASGYPTGLLDADKVEGNVLLGIGRSNEPYEAIGRGMLNIEGLPVYRDEKGGIASPTSDSTRTMLTQETKRLLFIINGYDGCRQEMEKALCHALDLLQRYAQGANERVVWF